jgi:allantoinase
VLSTGEITFVASDHSPAPPQMKRGDDFFKIWGGIAGVQSTLSAVLDLDPPLPLPSVAEYTAAAAARRFDIPSKGTIAKGNDADLALVDLWAYYELTRDMLLDRHKLSPFVGRQFRGVVRRTLVRGHTVFRDGKIVAGDFRGRLVTPGRRRGEGAGRA